MTTVTTFTLVDICVFTLIADQKQFRALLAVFMYTLYTECTGTPSVQTVQTVYPVIVI